MSQFEQPFEDFQSDQHREVDFSDNDPSKKFTKLDEARLLLESIRYQREKRSADEREGEA